MLQTQIADFEETISTIMLEEKAEKEVIKVPVEGVASCFAADDG